MALTTDMDTNLTQTDRPATPTDEATCKRLTTLTHQINTLTAARDGLKLTLEMLASTNNFNSDDNPYYEKYLKEFSRVDSELALRVSEMSNISCPIPGCTVHADSPHNVSSPPTTPNINHNKRGKDPNSDDEFQFPHPRKVARGLTFDLNLTPPPIDTSNAFNQLGSTDADFPPLPPTRGNGPFPPVTTTITTPPKPILPPPVMLKITQTFRSQVHELTTRIPALRNKLSGEYIKLYTNNEQEYRKLINLLANLNYEYYVIRPKMERPIKVVIKGLPRVTLTTEVESDLRELGFSPEKVTQLMGRVTKKPMPVYLVQLPRNIANMKIFELQTLGYMSVTVEGYNGRGTTQCFRCNKFHHTSENCHITPRCLKCGLDHETRDCSITHKLEPMFCINCDIPGHMANWPKCPRFPKPPP